MSERMQGIRVVLITRRFWPLADDVERTLARLATGLQQRGAAVTVLTARRGADWPARVDYRGTPVVRLPTPFCERWQSMRYLVALGRWLRKHRHEIDVVCVSRLRSDAYAALRTVVPTGVPVVLRAESAGVSGDCRWQERVRLGRRIRHRCQTADALIAPDLEVEQELCAAGYPQARLQRISNGIDPAIEPAAAKRAAARLTLADTNVDLDTPARAPVVVYAGRMSDDPGLPRLIRAWLEVRRQWPSARLWLVGDGPARDQLRDCISDAGLCGCVHMPGVFEDLEDVLHAADVYVDPCEEPGLPLPLLEAMASGVPVVAATARRSWAQYARSSDSESLVPVAGEAALSAAILRLLDKPPRPEALAQIRADILQQHSLATMVDQHWQLFARLVQEKASAHEGD